VQKEEGDTEMLRVAMDKISSSSFYTLPTFDVQRKINEIRAVIPLLGSLLLGFRVEVVQHMFAVPVLLLWVGF